MKYKSILFACESIPKYKLERVRKKRLALARAGVAPAKFPIILLESAAPPPFDPDSYPPGFRNRTAEPPFPPGELLSVTLRLFSANVPVLLCNSDSKRSVALTERLQSYCLAHRLSYFTCLY